MVRSTRLLVFGIALLTSFFAFQSACFATGLDTIENNTFSRTSNVADPPIACAGQGHTSTVGKIITVNGSQSTGHRPLFYTWSIPSKPPGSTAVLINPNSVVAILKPDVAGDYTIRLVVTDARGTISQPSEVTIRATSNPASYYVDYSQGVDNDICSKDQPCKHVPGSYTYSGSVILAAGDAVYFKRGVTYGEAVGGVAIPTVPGVTYSVDPTFTTNPSDDTLKAIIDGQRNETVFWINGSGVKISGVDSRKLLKIAGSVARQAIAYVGQGSQAPLSSVTVQYLEISVGNTATGSSGIGVRVGDGLDSQPITGGEIHHNLIHDCGGYGIKVSAGPPGVSGVDIHDNEVFGCGGGALLESNVNISSSAGTISLDFHHNKVHDPSSSASHNLVINNPGIMVHDNDLYSCSNGNLILNPATGPGIATGKVYSNFIRAASRGLYIGTSKLGQEYTIYNNLLMGNTIGIYLQEDAAAAYRILNNTVYSGPGQLAMKFWPENNGLIIRNNILYTQNALCIFCDPAPEPDRNSVDYNVQYRADGGNRGPYAITPNGIVTNPFFQTISPSPTAGLPNDFKISSASPAKDHGETRAEFALDYFGTIRPAGASWDIGFHELTVAPTPGILAVTPSDGFISSGPRGGPFTPSNKTYTLRNTGGSAISWAATKSRIWDTLSSTRGTLAPGAAATVTVSLNANSLAVGSYTDIINFMNNTNGNGTTARTVNLTVTVPARPDLTVPSLTVPATARRGTRITVTDTTTNTGNAAAPATTTRLYLSSNTTWESNDTYLGSRSVPVLAAGATSTGNTLLTIPYYSPLGTRYIIGRADGGNAVTETSETNNTAYRSIVIGR